ncbi:PAS domain S-box protein [Chloroflexia bacterium SDU3-3]|nr:PAS domain S-box protein [Chloroflexia bacterium SDU3-3]
MKTFFNPAVLLLSRLRYPQKFALISILFAIPLAFALGSSIIRLHHDIAFTKKEQAGLSYLRSLNLLLEHALLEQRLAAMFASGQSAVKNDLVNNQQMIQQDFRTLQDLDARHGEALGTTTDLAVLSSSWDALRPRTFDMLGKQSDDIHASFVGDIQDLIAKVGDSSNLIIDPDLDSTYMIENVLRYLPGIHEEVSQVAAFGQRLIEQQSVSDTDKSQFTMLSGQVRLSIDSTKHGMDAVFARNPPIKIALSGDYQKFVELTDGFVTATNQDLIYAAQIPIDSASYNAQAKQALEANLALWESSSEVLDGLLEARLAELGGQYAMLVGLSALMLLAVTYLWVGFYFSVMDTVGALGAAARRMLEGSTSEVVLYESRDEFSQVISSFNDLMHALATASAERQAIVDNTYAGILTVNHHGYIQSANPAIATLFGYNVVDVIGRPVADLLPVPYAQEYRHVGPAREVVGQHMDGSPLALELAVGEMMLDEKRLFVALLTDLSERKRTELERAQMQEQIIAGQKLALAELSTPLIPISDDVLVMPLIGTIDSQRAQQIIQSLLEGVEHNHTRVAILDITGVPVVDTQVAKSLIVAAEGVELLGAQVVLTGIRPEVAQTLVGLGIDLSAITTYSSLQIGVAMVSQLRRTRARRLA